MAQTRTDVRTPRSEDIANDRPATALDPRSEHVLELQRRGGNRAVAQLLRQPAQAPAKPKDPTLGSPYKVKDVDEKITETISHAPTKYARWNGTYEWRAKWRLRLDQRAEVGGLDIVPRLCSTASKTVKQAWEKAIVAKWSNKFAFCVLRDKPIGTDVLLEMYPIRILIVWESDPKQADYVITPNAPGAKADGRAGLGGTTSMTGWGTADTVDIAHEFGHMLGCPEEYFTTNGVDFTQGGKLQGFRDPKGGVMNNPAGPVLARNFEFVRKQAAGLRGIALNKTAIRPWR